MKLYRKREVPWDMIYADDLIVAEDLAANVHTRFSGSQKAPESNGLTMNAGKTESTTCSKVYEPLITHTVIETYGSKETPSSISDHLLVS